MKKSLTITFTLLLLFLSSCASYRPSDEGELESIGQVDVGSSGWLGDSETGIKRPDSGEGIMGEAESAAKGGTLEESDNVEF